MAWADGLRQWRGILTVAGMTFLAAPYPADAAEGFDAWVDGVRSEAVSRGIRPSVVDVTFAGVGPIDKVIELDRRQPEFTRTFWNYLDQTVSSARIARGQAAIAGFGPLLEDVRAKYGVQPRFVVALWAVETNFGDNVGSFPTAASLATLAYDGRRSAFFREELMALLTLIDRGDVQPDAVGSWAGAIGQPQFMPSTYVSYAVDGDGNGRRDLWRDLADVFASAANYLHSMGWDGSATWGREVRLPPDFDYAQADQNLQRPVNAWQAAGVRMADGSDLPRSEMAAAVVLPAGADGPAFIVYPNFNVLMRWNRSLYYALAVGHLADRLDGAGPLLAMRPASDEPLARSQVIEIQTLLMTGGYLTGSVDGIVGPDTRQAIRTFQQMASLPADGYPSPALLARLRAAASQ